MGTINDEEFSTPHGLDHKYGPVLDEKTKEAIVNTKAKMSSIHAEQNMIELFGQEVLLIPIISNTFTNPTPEADTEDEAEYEHQEPAAKREDVASHISVVASTDRATFYDGQPCMMTGEISRPSWSPIRSTLAASEPQHASDADAV